LSELVAYYGENPIEVKGNIEIDQEPISSAARSRSIEGATRTSLVYVRAPSEAGLLIPFGDYDDWSLRDRYNEAIRIMNSLGASSIRCEAYREVAVRRGFRAKVLGRGGAKLTQQRIENSGFDFRHDGAGSAPRDPRPLRWPDEPGFSAAVTSVLENGSTELDIHIRSNRSHAIDGTLGIKLKGFGFDLGGMTQHSGATSLHIGASFAQNRKK